MCNVIEYQCPLPARHRTCCLVVSVVQLLWVAWPCSPGVTCWKDVACWPLPLFVLLLLLAPCQCFHRCHPDFCHHLSRQLRAVHVHSAPRDVQGFGCACSACPENAAHVASCMNDVLVCLFFTNTQLCGPHLLTFDSSRRSQRCAAWSCSNTAAGHLQPVL